jgi:DNA replication protein DnaC
MTDEETLQKLRELKLKAMSQTFEALLAQTGDPSLSFNEKVAMMVDAEAVARENRRLARLLKAAKLSTQACLEDVVCDPSRGLEKPVVRTFAQCKWINAKQNIIVIGKTGVGKSFLSCALAEAACRNGYRALVTRVPRLLHELAMAKADGSFTPTLAKLAKLDVLVLDDFLLTPLKESERRDLLEVLEDRYDKSSTIITSQVLTKNWHEMLADPTIADAICDRVVHNAHVVSLRGPSLRKQKGTASTHQPQPAA